MPHTLGALDGKHITMKKPKKSRNDYYNYKDFFSLVLLAMVDAEYRFLFLIDCESSGSASDAQIFNRVDLREKIEDVTLGFTAPDPLGEGGPDLNFAVMPLIVKPYSRRQLTWGKNSTG